jgi:OOP family OmpA-OmpF porin
MKKGVILLSLALASTAALAENNFDDRFYVTPSFGLVKPDSDKNLDSDFFLSLGLGRFVTPHISLDIEADHYHFAAASGSPEVKYTGYGLMGRYHFNENHGWRPFVGFGAGTLKHKSLSAKGHNMMYNLAGGLTKSLTDNVKLKTELRYRLDTDDATFYPRDNFGDWMFSLGLNVALGEAPAAAAAAAGAAAMHPAPQTDSDHDGVNDANDKCPNTPQGDKVDANGCSIDTGMLDDDRDGVVNRDDQCPQTRAGAVVDKTGCEVQVVIELQGVHFDYDKATLKPESIRILDAAVNTLKNHPQIKVEVAGHTDSRGSEAYNQQLSERRAKVVYDYLVDHGIDANRLSWRGYGESQPIADNSTEAGRAQNRRTELKVQ